MTPEQMKELKRHVSGEVRRAAIMIISAIAVCTATLIFLLQAVLK